MEEFKCKSKNKDTQIKRKNKDMPKCKLALFLIVI